MASWAPFHSGKPSTATSNLRPSSWLNSWRSMSRTRTFTRTRPPASRHTHAATFSRTQPRRPKTPAVRMLHGGGQGRRGTATPAGTGRQRQREPEAAEEQNAKRLRCQTELLFRRDGCERCRSHGARLGTEESGFCVSQLRTHGAPEVTSLNRLSGQLLPPLSRQARFCILARGLWLLRQEILPRRRVETFPRQGCGAIKGCLDVRSWVVVLKASHNPPSNMRTRSKTILRLSAQLAQ